MAVLYPKHGTAVAAGGTFSLTVPANHGMCKQLVVKAATATTTFDVRLTDIYSFVVLNFTDVIGTTAELIELPCYGSWTLTVSNASADESFSYLVTVLESL